MYRKEPDDYAGRFGGKQAQDKYLASLMTPVPHKKLRVSAYPAENGACGYCFADHTFQFCPERKMAEVLHMLLPAKRFSYLGATLTQT